MTTQQTTDPVLNAFNPIGASNARLMILGSMPGAASLADAEYYAHPRNAFWPVMQAIFGGSIKTYTDKCNILSSNRIVVWDVLAQCVRPGSLDSNIRRDSVVCNDFATFLRVQSDLRCIAFNGKTAEQLFRRHAVPQLQTDPCIRFTDSTGKRLLDQQIPNEFTNSTAVMTVQLTSLPSTSPAMASLTLDDKTLAWSNALLQHVIIKPLTDNQV